MSLPKLLSRLGIVLPILLILAVAPVAWQFSSWSQWNSLHSGGLVTEGKVVDLTIEDDDSGKYYIVSYGYSLKGAKYTHNQDVSRSLYDRLGIGRPVKILYASDNPNNVLLADTESPSIDIPFYIVWYSILLVAVLIILFADNPS